MIARSLRGENRSGLSGSTTTSSSGLWTGDLCWGSSAVVGCGCKNGSGSFGSSATSTIGLCAGDLCSGSLAAAGCGCKSGSGPTISSAASTRVSWTGDVGWCSSAAGKLARGNRSSLLNSAVVSLKALLAGGSSRGSGPWGWSRDSSSVAAERERFLPRGCFARGALVERARREAGSALSRLDARCSKEVISKNSIEPALSQTDNTLRAVSLINM